MFKRNIILQPFTWKISEITKQLDKIKECGYNEILVSPIQPTKDNGYEFWKLYQPLGFTIGNFQIGNKDDLIELTTKAKEYDIRVGIDIVLRHTASLNTGELKPHELVSNELKSNKYFWTEKGNINDYNNRWELCNLACGVPMLNYENRELQKIYIRFLNSLINCNIDFIRLDQGKHFGLPQEEYSFFTYVFGNLKDKLDIYAECLQLNKELLDMYEKYCYVITDSYSSDRTKEICYIESHDDYHTWGTTKRMNDNLLTKEWEVLLKNNRQSLMMFFTRPWSNLWCSDEIKRINNTYK